MRWFIEKMLEDKGFFKFVYAKIFGLKNCRFWYGVKKNFENFSDSKEIGLGTLVRVPLKNSTRFALVDQVSFQAPEGHAFQIKEIVDSPSNGFDPFFYDFVRKVSQLYLIQEADLYSSLVDLVSSAEKRNRRRLKKTDACDEFYPTIPEFLGQDFLSDQVSKEIVLTDEQVKAIDGISKKIIGGGFEQFLLYGVTGSGKTEVYKHLIKNAAKLGKSSILLLPEIGLCERFFEIFKELDDDGLKVVRYHSALGAADKRKVWEALNSKSSILLIGVHLPTFLPVYGLGLVLVDEEHEEGFCRRNNPRIDSKKMLILRAKIYKIPVVLGSATPSVDCLKMVQDKSVTVYRLTKKLSESVRSTEVVNLTVKEKRINFWISRRLELAIEERLERGEQSIIFINRRGHSFSAQCKDCGTVLECQNCSVSLTIHKQLGASFALCHYCGFKELCQKICKNCRKEGTLIFKGVGTQKIAAILSQRFPQARILRVDLDSSKDKKEWSKVVGKVLEEKVDILVGTQSIAKGYHFPGVTLIGVIWADLDFNFPSYDAQERAVQRLLQVSGRAGRGQKPGLVILQTMQSLKLLDNLDESNYESFCQNELEMRKAAQFPPFYKFYQVQLSGQDGAQVEQEAAAVCQKILNAAKDIGFDQISLIGPFKPPIHRLEGTEIREILLKSDSLLKISEILGRADFSAARCRISFRPLF